MPRIASSLNRATPRDSSCTVALIAAALRARSLAATNATGAAGRPERDEWGPKSDEQPDAGPRDRNRLASPPLLAAMIWVVGAVTFSAFTANVCRSDDGEAVARVVATPSSSTDRRE
jgi:hypothetical protein